MRAKPQPSAMLNQAHFALTWPLSPFLLSLLPKLVKPGCTEQLLWLFPTAHGTLRSRGFAALIQRVKEVAHKAQQKNTLGRARLCLPAQHRDLADRGKRAWSCSASAQNPQMEQDLGKVSYQSYPARSC